MASQAPQASFKLSVVISNYNYGRFVANAIDSALALEWPDVEVIAVDNGSTDNSIEVIKSYGSRIRCIFQKSTMQLDGCNAGFAISTGDAVMFLDSDDAVHPSLAREVAAVWRSDVSKVQVQMGVVDAQLMSTGQKFPQFFTTPSPSDARQWLVTTGTYPTPPGSGNVYSRWFLQRIFPLEAVAGTFSDSCCIAAAPVLGEVVTVAKPLVLYRQHGSNDGAMSVNHPDRMAREVQRALDRFAFTSKMAATVGIPVDAQALRRSLHLYPYRVCSVRLDPRAHPMADDSRWLAAIDGLTALRWPQGWRSRTAWIMVLWGWLVLFAPRPVLPSLVRLRFTAISRPRIVSRILVGLGFVRG